MRFVGETNGQMATGGRSGSQGAISIDGCNQRRSWSHVEATTPPRCAFGSFPSRLGESQALLEILVEREAPISDNGLIMHTMKLFKTIAIHSIGCCGRMLLEIEDSYGIFLYLSDVFSDVVQLTIYRPSRCCALVPFIGETLIEVCESHLE